VAAVAEEVVGAAALYKKQAAPSSAVSAVVTPVLKFYP